MVTVTVKSNLYLGSSNLFSRKKDTLWPTDKSITIQGLQHIATKWYYEEYYKKVLFLLSLLIPSIITGSAEW